MIGPALDRRGFTYVVVTLQRQEVERLARARHHRDLRRCVEPGDPRAGRTSSPRALVIVASSDAQATLPGRPAGASTPTPAIDVVGAGRTATREAAQLRALGVKVLPIHGERELGVQMARYSLRRFGVPTTEAEAIAQGLRHRAVR